LILSPAGQSNMQVADVFTTIPYLHLRDIAMKTGRRYSILSEIISELKSNLAVFDDPADATISSGMVALILAQLAENKDLGPVLVDLLGPDGAHIVLRPAGDYVGTGGAVDFQTVIAAARCRGETALGYRLLAEAGQAGDGSGVYLNPERSASITFKEQDFVIALANERQALT
jgi:hypothetical protein